MLHIGKPYKGGTYQRSMRQIERPMDFCLCQRVYLLRPLTLREMPQIDNRHAEGNGWLDDLDRLACNIRKNCAQDLMAPDNFLETVLQSYHLKRAAETYRFQQVVGVATKPKLIEEPQALLGRRQWEGAVSRYGMQRLLRQYRCTLVGIRNAPGNIRCRRCLEKAAE